MYPGRHRKPANDDNKVAGQFPAVIPGKVTLEKITITEHYASGSALAFINGRLYLVGDNMGHVLVLNEDFEVTDTITIIDASANTLPKATKPDIEASLAVNGDKLLLMGSGSLVPYRNSAWLVNTTSRQYEHIDLSPYYDRLKAQGLPNLNIEGAAAYGDNIVLANRGNKGYPENQLIITSAGFWNDQQNAPVKMKRIGEKTRPAAFSGVSGMDYSTLSDCLLLTLSTEDTYDPYADGAIGKSYLWLVNNLSRKEAAATILPDRVIDLEAVDTRFKGQKTETVCILHETEKEMTLAMAADNDTGNTVLFKVRLRK